MTLPADSTVPENDPAGEGDGTIFTPYRITQFFVVVAGVVCIVLFWWAGKSLAIPADRGFNASVLQQPHWPLVLVSIYVVFAVCLVLGTLVSGRWWFFGGLFAAVVGLGVLSVSGGPMHYVLFDAQSTGSPQRVFSSLAVETILLFLPIGLAWTFLWGPYERSLPASKASASSADVPLGVTVMAQVVFTGVIVLVFAATDAKKQVLVSVFLASLIGSALADHSTPHRGAARWFWIGPMAVGVIGYVLAYFNATAWTTGAPTGTFAGLARPLPLDYASAGAAGALLGYWVAADRPRVKFRWATPNRQPPQPQGTSEPTSKPDGA